MPVKLALSERVRGSSVQYISVCFLICNDLTMGEAWVSPVLSTLFVMTSQRASLGITWSVEEYVNFNTTKIICEDVIKAPPV